MAPPDLRAAVCGQPGAARYGPQSAARELIAADVERPGHELPARSSCYRPIRKASKGNWGRRRSSLLTRLEQLCEGKRQLLLEIFSDPLREVHGLWLPWGWGPGSEYLVTVLHQTGLRSIPGELACEFSCSKRLHLTKLGSQSRPAQAFRVANVGPQTIPHFLTFTASAAGRIADRQREPR